MSVRSKFYLILCLIIIEALVLSSMMYWMRNVEQTHNERIAFAHSQLDELFEIALITNKQFQAIPDLLNQNKQSGYEDFTFDEKRVLEKFDRLEHLTLNEIDVVDEDEKSDESGELKVLASLRILYGKITREAKNAFDLQREGNDTQAYEHFATIVKKTYSEDFYNLLHEQIKDERSEVNRTHSSIEAENLYYRIITTTVSILSALALIIIVFLISKGVIRQISLFIEATKKIGMGLFDTRLSINSKNEFGQLASTINSMSSDLQESRNQMETAKDNLDNILSSMLDTLFVIDRKGGIQKVNRSAENLLGYREEELLNKPIETIFAIGNGPLTQGADVLQLVRNGGCYALEQSYQARDGTHIPMLISSSPYYDQSGRHMGAILVAQDTSKLRKAENQVHFLAYYDHLCGLPNRRLFDTKLQESIDQSSSSSSNLALIVLDLDHFKMVNDSLGHDIGDIVIRVIAERIRKRTKKTDILSRIGGDEFSIILHDTSNPLDVAIVSQDIMDEFDKPIIAHGDPIFIRASIGISIYPDDASDSQVLFKCAESALHLAKDLGRNNYQFYTPELTQTSFENLFLVSSIRRALENDEFVVFYQPQLSMTDNSIISVEALVRWQHPEKGLLSPGSFLPIAEKTNLISDIGTQVLYKACRQAKQWHDAGLPPITVAVNMAGQQINFEQITEDVRSALQNTGLNPKYLELEITENFFLGTGERIGIILRELSAMGITISIDDFGTGFSSLGYLQRLPISKLKIDQSFVNEINENENDKAIVRAIIAMGKSLGLRIIAEGVETHAQKYFLESEGCDEYQGFLFSQPVPATALEIMLTEKFR